MYLKEIVAVGFKSFAEKINIKMDDKITCIVGPNGSGKSNVVDAVRWVLGEQSVKSLRGDGSMSDVIFSGSKSRNPLNVASVELIFDNSDHFINLSYTELSIKRRVYRSGENEYYLNNEKCRLKDITNLLMDSGMGKESFNIISQGEVEKILSNSSFDRRVIFEEAAGILKYRKRKEEALRKLDRTHTNIERVNDIITELSNQVEPLKKQAENAKEYLENKKGLDKYEVALLSFDITKLNDDLTTKKIEQQRLDKQITDLSNSSIIEDSTTLNKKNHLDNLEEKYQKSNKNLIEITSEVERLRGEKNLLNEQNKNNKDQTKTQEEIRNLLEQKALIQGKILINRDDFDNISKEFLTIKEEINQSKKEIEKFNLEKNSLISDINKFDREIVNNNYKKDSLNKEIEEGGAKPNSVKQILKSTTLTGIHNTIESILTTDSEYVKALEISISSSKNFIITEDESSSKTAINYLKDNKLGRATFFPLSVIKPRYIDQVTLSNINENPDFIGILSDLCTYNNKYKNIVLNQLGTTLVTKDIDSAIRVSKIINNRYKIVTILGDVINVGGSMSGGSSYNSRSTITLKQEINNLLNKNQVLDNQLKDVLQEKNIIEQNIQKLENKVFSQSESLVVLHEKISNNKKEFTTLEEQKTYIETSLTGLNSISNNNFNQLEVELINKFHEKTSLKEMIEKDLITTKKEIDNLKIELEEFNASIKLKNSKLRNLEKEKNEIELIINRYNLKIDNMLETLSTDYEMTYEKAQKEYILDIDDNEARKLVNNYRAAIKRIGMVNIDSIEEYEKVNTRYEFLTNQREDLLSAENTLLEIMNEMDDVMREEFKTTFEKIQIEFQQVFTKLFNGGTARLELTDKNDLLKTGVDIIASPPGKKLTTINLLSGGEKTLTAISLLFAILNVRRVPFCLFDEVEAALDEANVLGFGKYLQNYRDKTQFLIITHKKKTMEYANTLYGITMQESGVSKLVSVKLKDKE